MSHSAALGPLAPFPFGDLRRDPVKLDERCFARDFVRLLHTCPAVSHQRSDPVGKRSTVRAAKYDGTSVRDGNPVDRRAAAGGISDTCAALRSLQCR